MVLEPFLLKKILTQDASTRTLAALNRIKVNFTFVMKTALDQQVSLVFRKNVQNF